MVKDQAKYCQDIIYMSFCDRIAESFLGDEKRLVYYYLYPYFFMRLP
jgi:hypothetical protein